MGCFNSTKSKKYSPVDDKLCHYPRSCKVNIKMRNATGDTIGTQTVSFQLTDPILISSKELTLSSEKLLISSCVLPGLDPRGEYMKKCQDNCFYLHDSSTILCCLFDGHGREGEKVAAFCESIISKLFREKKQALIVKSSQDDPSKFMKMVTKKCDEELVKNSNKIDCDYSGCTGVLVYITQECIYCGSVGDSRSIIGTTFMPDVLPAPPAHLGTERNILATVKQKRKSVIETQMNSIQLTRDQKPEDPEELERIIEAGGRVQRLTDNIGNKVGPYRVWEKNSNSPGLAMSRSIGDMVAKNIGVISDPVCTNYTRVSGDLFLVIASDGVWDAMDNEDVGSFVEHYRRKCKTNVSNSEGKSEVNYSNSCIAQILSEEARLRWFTIVEEEDVMVDDISCIVVEIKRNEEIMARHSKRPVPVEDVGETMHEEKCEEFKRAPTLKEIAVKDPRRGSIVEGGLPNFQG